MANTSLSTLRAALHLSDAEVDHLKSTYTEKQLSGPATLVSTMASTINNPRVMGLMGSKAANFKTELAKLPREAKQVLIRDWPALGHYLDIHPFQRYLKS